MSSSLTKNRLKARRLIEKGLIQRNFIGKWPFFYRIVSNYIHIIEFEVSKYGGSYFVFLARIEQGKNLRVDLDQLYTKEQLCHLIAEDQQYSDDQLFKLYWFQSYHWVQLGSITISVDDEYWFLPVSERKVTTHHYTVKYDLHGRDNHPLLPELSSKEQSAMTIEEEINRLFILLDLEGEFYFLTGKTSSFSDDIKAFHK